MNVSYSRNVKEHCTIFPVYGDDYDNDDADCGSDAEWQIEMGVRIFIADNNWHQSIYDEYTSHEPRSFACVRVCMSSVLACAYLGSKPIYVNILQAHIHNKCEQDHEHLYKRQSESVCLREKERNRAKNYVETTNGAKNKTDKWK